MKLGLGIGPMGPPGGERIIALAKEAENLGYDTIWCPEIYGMDCFTPLAWSGAHTSRINLGTSIMQISARTPASAAMHAVATDYLSNGRRDLGIGVGWYQAEQTSYGLDWVDQVGERLNRLEEAIEVMKALFTQPQVTYEGRFYKVNDAACQPSPVQKPWPRLWIGGGGEQRTLRIVAKHADAWNIPAISPEEYARKLGVLREHCRAVGRDYDEIEKTMETRALVVDGPGSMDRLVDWFLYWQRTADGATPDRDAVASRLEQMYIIGTLDDCIEKVGRYVDAGVEHFTVYFLDYPETRTMELFASEVMPAFA